MTRPLAPGGLRDAVAERARQALACGALERIDTVEEVVVDAGVSFTVRRVSSLERKQRHAKRAASTDLPPANPFLPHDPSLFVADVSDSHRVLLNKFNVLDYHLLIVTRAFVHQETLLEREDFDALAVCMAQLGGLGFYNAGAVAGASQPHKHLQLVPLPLGRSGGAVPMEALFEALPRRPGVLRLPALAFAHAFAWLDEACFSDAGASLRQAYRDLCEAVGIAATPVQGEARQSAPYNLLLTGRWMLLVPRSCEHFDSVSINALAFAGSIFVRDQVQLRAVKKAGPMAVLREVSMAGARGW